jgi:hypothetical protein
VSTRKTQSVPRNPAKLVSRNAAATLTAADVSGWLTLQTLLLAQPGVCTETEMFYRAHGPIYVSELNAQILIEPGSALHYSTAYNLLGLEALEATCRLGRLAFALRGTGLVEVIVFQGLAGRSWQRLVSDIVMLNPEEETVLDLDCVGLNRREGALWVELRAVDDAEDACIQSGRFLTDTQPDPATRLAICRPQRAMAEHAASPDRMFDRLAAWAAAQNGRAALFTCGPVAQTDTAVISLPATPDRHSAHQAMVAAARAQGFTHVLMLDPDTTLGVEMLDRTLAWASILRSGNLALGASLLDAAEASQLSDNGLLRTAEGRLAPHSGQFDLREIGPVLDAGYEAVSDSRSGLIVPRSTFVAFPLAALGDGPASALIRDRLGVDEVTCLAEGLVQVNQMPGLVIRRDTFGRKVTGLLTLQNLIFPEQGICTEGNMFFHGHGAVVYDERSASITVVQGATAAFDTYFNALSIGKWHENCALNGLWLGLTGRGRVEVKVFHAIPDRSWELLATTIVSLSKGNESLVDLSHYADNATRGVIFFEVRALSHGVALTAARYMTEGAPNPARRLALSITTFKREAQVENTARRLAHYFERADFAPYMDCYIVDNGDSAKIIAHPKIHRIPNANLGGAGGFTRGLLEAEAAGYSHVLFMDDDASIPMEALHRTYAFLTLANDPKAAIAGAMINNTDKWRMWENGATFDQRCYPLFTGTDLRDRDAVIAMENESALSRSTKMYGGWWFFAFPVAEVKRHPFPFFVRGDDVNFSLVNEFAITTLNGVVSFADDFIDKESPLTWYLDLRSHMVHHLTLDKMEVGRVALVKIGLSFFKRNIVKFQYETLEAVLMAWEHVLQGPDFFTQNADASAPRAAIKALTKVESWKPVADVKPVTKSGFLDRRLSLRRKFYPFSLNGHFLPLFPLWGSKRVIPAWQRGHLDAVWGAAQLTFLSSNRDKAYVTKRSNWKAAKLLARLTGLSLRTLMGYNGLRALYHRRYPEITTPDYWRGVLTVQKSGVAKEKAAEVKSAA